ncbi:MAG: putative SAM-dependent methyltransferase [Candidatus Levybacteria bacterium]|nr:putative SAM-dependent methyltransferase [Candidatus Levybacteria bacterium]
MNPVRKNWANPPWYSSYEKNNYGDFFYALMRVYQPEKVVELGTKAGYSAYHMARGLKDNGKGTLDCYDLWEEYEFNSVPRSVAEKNLKKFKNIVSFNLRDAVGADKKYKEIDILHVDLSNKGEILEEIIPHWIDKVSQFIIIEGGSKERDKVEWMTKFKKKPIANWLRDFARKRKNIEYVTIEPFPSVTILRKK